MSINVVGGAYCEIEAGIEANIRLYRCQYSGEARQNEVTKGSNTNYSRDFAHSNFIA